VERIAAAQQTGEDGQAFRRWLPLRRLAGRRRRRRKNRAEGTAQARHRLLITLYRLLLAVKAMVTTGAEQVAPPLRSSTRMAR
jgi:hypothetical protein